MAQTLDLDFSARLRSVHILVRVTQACSHIPERRVDSVIKMAVSAIVRPRGQKMDGVTSLKATDGIYIR